MESRNQAKIQGRHPRNTKEIGEFQSKTNRAKGSADETKPHAHMSPLQIARPGHAVLILVLDIVVSFGLEYSFVSYPFRNIRAFQLSAFLQYLETETEFKNFAFCYVFSIRSPYIYLYHLSLKFYGEITMSLALTEGWRPYSCNSNQRRSRSNIESQTRTESDS